MTIHAPIVAADARAVAALEKIYNGGLLSRIVTLTELAEASVDGWLASPGATHLHALLSCIRDAAESAEVQAERGLGL